MDLELDTTTDDLAFDANGDLNLIDGIPRMVQQNKIRLRSFQGEWFRDLRVGMPWYQRVLGVKPFRKAVIVNDIRRTALGIPGIRDVYDITFEFDPTTRSAQIRFRGVDTSGNPITFDEPFILG